MASIAAFKDPTRLSKAIFIALLVDILASVTSAVIGVEAILFIERMKADGFASFAAGQAAAAAIEERQSLAGTFQLAVFVIAGALILVWIRRMNANARALGAENMRFTPGWAIGWYFVPVANLWKPYQAMKEIWRASADPASWRQVDPPALLPVWWFLWLVTNFLSQGSARLADRVDNIDLLTAAYVTGSLADIAKTALDLVFILLVSRLTRMQLSARTSTRIDRVVG